METPLPLLLEEFLLPRTFYERPTEEVARDLLGKVLLRDDRGKRLAGRIVEVEAYLGAHDLACHSARGKTTRTEVMFGPGGRAYVYMIYGMYHCLNVVTEPEGSPCAVLIRALEPLGDLPGAVSGPGRLCRTLSVDRSLTGHDLSQSPLTLLNIPSLPALSPIARSPRIGVGYAGEWADKPLRFFIDGNPWVSGPKPPRKRRLSPADAPAGPQNSPPPFQ
jgi:DNA-3-methyladenine glycosylase